VVPYIPTTPGKSWRFPGVGPIVRYIRQCFTAPFSEIVIARDEGLGAKATIFAK
jgi:hypothetical protein